MLLDELSADQKKMSPGYILWEPWISVLNVLAIHPITIENCDPDQPTLLESHTITVTNTNLELDGTFLFWFVFWICVHWNTNKPLVMFTVDDTQLHTAAASQITWKWNVCFTFLCLDFYSVSLEGVYVCIHCLFWNAQMPQKEKTLVIWEMSS